MVGMDIAWSGEFDFVVNNLAINHEVFQSSLRLDEEALMSRL